MLSVTTLWNNSTVPCAYTAPPLLSPGPLAKAPHASMTDSEIWMG